MKKNVTHPSELSLEEQSNLLQETWPIVNRVFESYTREQFFDRFDLLQYMLINYTSQNPHTLDSLKGDYMFVQLLRHMFEDLSPNFPEGASNDDN